MSSCKALGGVEEFPAAHVGSWKADKFKDLASLVKMSFKFRGYIGAFVCVSSLSVCPKASGTRSNDKSDAGKDRGAYLVCASLLHVSGQLC